MTAPNPSPDDAFQRAAEELWTPVFRFALALTNDLSGLGLGPAWREWIPVRRQLSSQSVRQCHPPVLYDANL
jgi:hypothetical protein